MASDEETKQAFAMLRPLCVMLTREHKCEHVLALQEAVQQLGEAELAELQEYILFPLRFILKQSTSKSCILYEKVCSCMAQVLLRTEIRDWSTWMDLFTTLCVLVNPPASQKPGGSSSPISEELKLQSIQCLTALIKRTEYSVISALYQPANLPPLGHAVSLLLNFAETEAMRPLQIACIKCLLCLAHCNKERKVNMTERVAVGDAFASFLPGIAMTLSRIATRDPKQGQAITTLSLDALAAVVAMVMGNQDVTMSCKLRSKRKKGEVNERLQNLVVERTQEWVSATAEKIKILFERVLVLKTHSNWNVRLALVHWAENLLLKCDSTLSSSLPYFLDVLVSSVGDDYANVASASQAVLKDYRTAHQGKHEHELLEILEDNLYNLATQLPRLMRTVDDSEKLSHLRLFAGYLQLLGPSTPHLLHSQAHLQRTALALMQVTQLDCSQVKIIAERSTGFHSGNTKNQLHTQRPRKYFQHFTDDKIYETITRICRLIGCHGDLDLIVDHLLDLYHQECYRKQAALCINEVIMGTAGLGLDLEESKEINVDQMKSVLSMIIEEYLAPDNIDLITSNQAEDKTVGEQPADWQIISTNQKPACSVEQLNSNILQVCIQLEGLGYFAQVLGAEFQVHLIQVLYVVLEKLGSETAMVGQTAHCVLSEIAQALQLSGIDELICVNSDYLVNSLSLRLRHLERYPSAPQVLGVILAHTEADVLPLVKHTIQEILLTLDDHHSDQATLLMRVLYHLITAIAKWFPQEFESADILKEPDGTSSVAEYLLEYHKQKQIADDLTTEEMTDIPGEGEYSAMADDTDMYNEEKKESPQHIKLVMEVLNRCIHLQSSPDPHLRLLVLRVIADACLVMQQSENDLLPLIHKLWPPFVQRFQDEEKLVTIQAYQTLAAMAESAKDFIRQRVTKDILPKMCSALTQQALISIKAGPAYKYTVAYKQQATILRHVAEICSHLDLRGRHLSTVIRACLPYLSARQPQGLQEACVGALRYCGKLEPDALWLFLYSRYSPSPLTPPHPDLPQFKFAGSGERNEYTDNVATLLKGLDATLQK